MKIYGVALLAACYLLGIGVGELLGAWLGAGSNVGGVGIAMLLLIVVSDALRKRGLLTTETDKGILFWSAMYIPVVVAMSATQNVKAALHGGWVAFAVGVLATAISFLLVPLIARIGPQSAPLPEVPNEEKD
jgi:malonate transporter MadL subunit